MRSQNLTLPYYRHHCRQVFGRDLWPDVDAGNKNTGGDKLQATNLYFVNGGMDPWRHVSVTARPTGDAVAAGVMECEGCAHCRDLKASADVDPPQVKTVKAEIRSHLASWIGGGSSIQQQSAQQTLPFNPFAMLPRMAL